MDKAMQDLTVTAKSATKEETERAFELLAREKERKLKIETGQIKGVKKWSQMSPEEKAASREASRRYQARNKILVAKARAAGFEATKEEIDNFLKAGAR